MQLNQALSYTFTQIADGVDRTVDGLDVDALTWRPDAQANSIAWLAWHLTRVIDSHVMDIADREQLWVADGWATRFNLPAGYRDTGYGHTPEQVGHIAPPDGRVLSGYHRAVVAATTAVLDGMQPDDFDRIVDRSFDPPVTAGVRFCSVIGDALQHVGQAGYVRGLHQRRRGSVKNGGQP